MPRVSIELSDKEIETLEKRAKKNFLSLKEQIEDIIRRSVIRGKSSGYKAIKPDDRLVGIFSREKRGNWRKKKKKKSQKKKS